MWSISRVLFSQFQFSIIVLCFRAPLGKFAYRIFVREQRKSRFLDWALSSSMLLTKLGLQIYVHQAQFRNLDLPCLTMHIPLFHWFFFSSKKVEDAVKACCILHNFRRRTEKDDDDPSNADGSSSANLAGDASSAFVNMAPARGRHSAAANNVRDAFLRYFMSPVGSVPWQDAAAERGVCVCVSFFPHFCWFLFAFFSIGSIACALNNNPHNACSA